jgi:AAA+ superfamily predicted ATPase
LTISKEFKYLRIDDKDNKTSLIKQSETKENTMETNNKYSDNSSLHVDNQLPQRCFPVIVPNSNRNSEKLESIEYLSYIDTISKLESSIELQSIKDNIIDIANFIIRSNERYVRLGISNPGLYYNIAINGNSGSGREKVAKFLYHIFYHLGVIGKGKLITIDSKEIYPGHVLDRFIADTQSGVILLRDAHMINIKETRGQREIISTLDEWFVEYKDNFIFILAGDTEAMSELVGSHNIKKHINFNINMPDLTNNQMLELIKYFASKEKYKIEKHAEETILSYIQYERVNKSFENVLSARRIVERAIINNGITDNNKCLTKENFYSNEVVAFEKKAEMEKTVDDDYFAELKSMVGLNGIKEKLIEIISYSVVQAKRKELGLKNGPLCMHMSFAGNPGTGKTTVARAIGKVLKKIGLLSTGNFVEVAREDLVGKYVGHTAAKTSEKIKEAEGGILFIDECYSLASNSNMDYGREVINTLVKKMEDFRENLVVIFAGYSSEMPSFFNMNPGLKDRIAFELDFPDYCPNELLDIWNKFFIDNQYNVNTAAKYEMEVLVTKLYENKEADFSNGRIVRKCFERAKMYQAVRVRNENLSSIEDLTNITGEDIRYLYNDPDLKKHLQNKELKKCIGFIK